MERIIVYRDGVDRMQPDDAHENELVKLRRENEYLRQQVRTLALRVSAVQAGAVPNNAYISTSAGNVFTYYTAAV